MESKQLTLHIKVTGRVQGVFFRVWTKKQAEKLGLAGWVRNSENGSVEIEVMGKEGDIKNFVEKLNEGSKFANVENIDLEEIKSDKRYDGFEIK